MNNTETKNIIESATQTLQLQSQALLDIIPLLNNDLINAVTTIAASKARLVISGIGKSAIVAQKIVATMNSTGTPALFMHAADAIHGDLGMIQQHDVVIIISKSGESPEIKVLTPLIKNFGNTIIAMVGNMQSYLALHSDIVLNTTVIQEACPNNLAPTTSTTVQMVMGDVLAICLMQVKQFGDKDFAKYHPGGTLGKKMYLRVADLIKQHEKPFVFTVDNIKNAIVEISKKRLGATAVLDTKKKLVGIITDGDVRRMFEQYEDFKNIVSENIMSKNAKVVQAETLAIHALEIMKENNISQLLVMNGDEYKGILHVQDLMREGII